MSAATLRCIRCADADPPVPVDGMAGHMWDWHGVLEVRWGYTLADLVSIATLAVNTARGWWAGDRRDLVAAAYDGLLDALLAAEHWPSRHGLLEQARTALHTYRNSELSFRGVSHKPGVMIAPRWAQYWLGLRQVTPSHEDRIVERATVPVLLGALPPRQRQAITTMAAADGDRGTAAQLMDLSPDAFKTVLRRARRSAIGLWLQHETPARVHGRHTDYRNSGESPLGHGTTAAASRHRQRKEQPCEPCRAAEAQAQAHRNARNRKPADFSAPRGNHQGDPL